MSQSPRSDSIRDLTLADIPFMLPLNNAHAKETSFLDERSLAALLNMARYARGIDRGATALLIAFEHTAGYVNENFNWFKANRGSFFYVDRVIISSAARGQGLAKSLYQDLFSVAKQAGHDRVVCEVNIEPPNPPSEAFHIAMGFVAIGEATIHNGSKSVRYFEKAL
jgi:predicted GNAT superfamily acetyltransferase